MAWPEVQSVPPKLFCYRCGLNSIPAPPGTTPRTRFLCRACCHVRKVSDPPEVEAAIHAVIALVPKEHEAPKELEGAGLAAWRTQSAEAEARALFTLLGRNGDSVESLRALILVPSEIEAGLLAYVRRHPEDAVGIERILRYRRRVAEEFERLVLAGSGQEPCYAACSSPGRNS